METRFSPQPNNPQRAGTLNAYIFALEEYKDTHYLRIDAGDRIIFLKMLPGKTLAYSYDAEFWHQIPQVTEEYHYLEDLLMEYGATFIQKKEITQKFHRNTLESMA